MVPEQLEHLPGDLPTKEPLPHAAAAEEAAKTSLSAPAVIGGHEMETAEAHGEAAHGEGHHETVEEEEEEKEEEPDAVTWTTALLLIGFLIIFVGILYLVNCTDEDIRAAIWGMINTTVSIFCAATFDNAVFRFFHFQLVLSPPPRGFGLKHDTAEIKSTVGISFALMASICLHAGLFMVSSDNHQLLFSIRTIGGHVYAFASILTFGFLQESQFFRQELWLVGSVVGLAFVVMVLSYQIILWLAKRCMSAVQWQECRVQRGMMKEMQLDASAISIGFLLCQTICYWLSKEDHPEKRFIPILHGYPNEQRENSFWILCGLATTLLIASAVWSIYLRPSKGTKICGCIGPFVFDYIGVLLSCTGCWCLQRAGLIRLFHFFKRSKTEVLEEAMACNRAMIVNAFVMSLLAVVCVIVIDKVADSVQKKEAAVPIRILVREGEDKLENSESQTTLQQLGTLTGMDLENLPSIPRGTSGLTEMLGDDELSRLGAGLRTVMTGFGLLVGICWDKAFETAHETVAETVPVFHAHPVIGTGLVAAVLLLFVVPAWYWYIVPNAMKDETEHKQDIEHQQSLMAHSKGPQVEISSSESGEGESQESA